MLDAGWAVGRHAVVVSLWLAVRLQAFAGPEGRQSEAGLSAPFPAGVRRGHRASQLPTPSLPGSLPRPIST